MPRFSTPPWPPLPASAAPCFVLQFHWLGQWLPDYCQSMLYFIPSDDPPAAFFNDAFNRDWAAIFAPGLDSFQAASIGCNLAFVWRLSTGTIYSGVVNVLTDGLPADPCPSQTQILFQKRTGIPAKPSGRFYVPQVPLAYYGAGGVLNSLAIANSFDLGHAIAGAHTVQGVTFFPAVYSIKAEALIPITEITLFPKVATLIKRSLLSPQAAITNYGPYVPYIPPT